MKKLLQVEDIRVAYDKREVVKGVSFSVQPGEIFGLLGPNGAGKTTTLGVIEGLLKPTAGTVQINSIDVQLNATEARQYLGVQLQATSFQPELTAAEIVQLYAGLYGEPSTKQNAAALLETVSLAGEGSKRMSQLSGGQRQRVSLLLATLHSPLVVLLDEPTVGLDPQSRRQLWRRIEDLRSHGKAIVLTTHSMEEAEAVCDLIAIIDHGKIISEGTPAGLIEKHKNDPEVRAQSHGKPTLEDVFIGLTGQEIRD
jgi:ABC-2 type transport system ATP-binding protein